MSIDCVGISLPLLHSCLFDRSLVLFFLRFPLLTAISRCVCTKVVRTPLMHIFFFSLSQVSFSTTPSLFPNSRSLFAYDGVCFLIYAHRKKERDREIPHVHRIPRDIPLISCFFYHMCIQISNGMSAPFPLNIVLLPVTMTETYLQVCICFSVSVSDPALTCLPLRSLCCVEWLKVSFSNMLQRLCSGQSPTSGVYTSESKRDRWGGAGTLQLSCMHACICKMHACMHIYLVSTSSLPGRFRKNQLPKAF